jgi:hypothetical protein
LFEVNLGELSLLASHHITLICTCAIDSVVPYFEILMRSKTIHEATRNVISCPFRVISWIVLAQGQTTRNHTQSGEHKPSPSCVFVDRTGLMKP